MKGFINRLLREGLLFERLTNVDSDVNLLFDEFFKNDSETVGRVGVITKDMFELSKTDTSILESEEAKIAHSLNPCTIIINDGMNYYNPNEKIIGISVNDKALNYIYKYDGNLKSAIDSLQDIPSQQNNLSKEFNEEKLKGSIHHELAHWIDDTMNNAHIKKRINKQMEKKTTNLGGIPVNATKMEIQGQIHNIKQLHNKYKDTWDDISFYKLLSLSIPLNTVYKSLSNDIKKRWVRDLKTRMAREGLLGKKMYY